MKNKKKVVLYFHPPFYVIKDKKKVFGSGIRKEKILGSGINVLDPQH
jgi:hypothetical protein